MKSNYEPLGKYIQLASDRNSDLQNANLIGLSIQKKFIPSISNTIGTDMSTYRIINSNQFAYSPVTSRNSDKITIALYQENKTAMVSQAYTVFEIIDTEKLLPDYLMMWFRRPEFDRYARFMSHGSAREIFEWESMCNTLLPVPKPDKQKEIVKEYNTIVNRIALNNQLIQKLEETAQAIYKQWFVDFEFPDENGKPYKSSGGEMEMNLELEKEIPVGWKYLPIENLAEDIITGKTPPTEDKENYGDYMPFVTIPDMHNKVFAYSAERYLSMKGVNWQKNKTLPLNSICVSCIGTAGLVAITSELCQTNQQINSVVCKKDVSVYYTFFTLRGLEQQIQEWGGKGSVGINMNKTEFAAMKIIHPQTNVMLEFDRVVLSIFNNLKLHQNEGIILKKLLSLLLSKLATIEN